MSLFLPSNVIKITVSLDLQVAFFGQVLEAAGALGLKRLRSLVEWECRQLVNTTTVSDDTPMCRRAPQARFKPTIVCALLLPR